MNQSPIGHGSCRLRVLPPSVLALRAAGAAAGPPSGVTRGWLVSLLFLLLVGCATAPVASPTIPVTVEADFGPAGKPAVRQVVQVAPGATPRDATEKAFPVEKGAVCCDPREVSTIDGVAADPATNRWWTISVNGSKKGVSPYKTRLKSGDVVRWEYKQYGQ